MARLLAGETGTLVRQRRAVVVHPGVEHRALVTEPGRFGADHLGSGHAAAVPPESDIRGPVDSEWPFERAHPGTMGRVPTRELDEPTLDWLAHDALPGRHITRAGTLSGGYRNDNVLLVTDSGERYVLRRYPRRNICAVEEALAARLRGVVAVPEVVAADPSGARAGEPALLPRFVAGTMLSEALPGSSPEVASRLGRAVGEALAAVGSVSFPYPGFFDDAGLIPTEVEPTAQLAAFVDDRLANGNAHGVLTVAEQDGLRRLAAEYEAVLADVAGARQLVHADYNPKNILVDAESVVAVLDWEFAFSSTPLFDIGNMLRFAAFYPPGYIDGFIAGFEGNGGELPRRWRRVSEGLDLYALADFLTRPPDSRYFRKAVALIRQRIAIHT
jgi:aminoglycoside phosphotransferase (APT) family kinase protein